MKQLNDFQKLENPQLVELNGEYGFIIVTEIDISLSTQGVIIMKGQSYNYENRELEKGKVKQIHFSVKENIYYNLDEEGKIID